MKTREINMTEGAIFPKLIAFSVPLVLSSVLQLFFNAADVIVVGSLLIIMAVMIFIFVSYLKLSGQQMKELEKARREAVHANKAKSEFLSSMSHDIRTPMNAIIGMTEIALKNMNDQIRLEDCIKKVQLSSKHLLGLINDVLDMSKIESGKMTLKMNPISLRDTMDDIVNIMQPQVKARNQLFDIFIQDIDFEDVYCDSMRLNQILLNLLSNAVKFTPENGKIDIHVFQEISPKGEEYVRTHFIVEDNGIGMTEEFQKKIWDSFSREDSDQVQSITGTGLGMAITKSIINIMEGDIELESELNKGSKFHITLDLKKGVRAEDMKLPEWNILVGNDKAWVNEKIMIDYLEWLFQNQSKGDPCALVLDCFKAHCTKAVKKYAEQRSIELIIVPANGTSEFQPLDRRIFGIIKSKLRSLAGTRIYTGRERFELIGKDLIHAWNEITERNLHSAWNIPKLYQLIKYLDMNRSEMSQDQRDEIEEIYLSELDDFNDFLGEEGPFDWEEDDDDDESDYDK